MSISILRLVGHIVCYLSFINFYFHVTNCLCNHIVCLAQSVKVREILCVNGECNSATAGPKPGFKGTAYRYILKKIFL